MNDIIQIVENAERTELDGRPYIVAPVVMNAGVVHPYPEERSDRFPNGYNAFLPVSAWVMELWNSRPIMANVHPAVAGQYVSALSPKLIDLLGIGQVYNVRAVGDRLCGDAWFDIRATANKAPGILAALVNRTPLACSASGHHHYKGEWGEGVQNGKPYHFLFTEAFPDHLTVTTGDGRCSKEDGCGLNLGGQR